MPSSNPKTTEQLRAIFGLGKKVNCGKKDLEELAGTMFDGKVSRLSLLSFDQANAMIHRLGGEPFQKSSPPFRGGLARSSADGVVASGSHPPLSRRTVNYHRQKAGVKQIAQPRHLKLMSDLAALRNISDEGLQKLCRRMLKGRPCPRTTAETNKIVEALKAMNARDALSSPPRLEAGLPASSAGGVVGSDRPSKKEAA